jgi:hypothetical protein
MSGLNDYYANNYKEFDKLMEECHYVMSVQDNADIICQVVGKLVTEIQTKVGINTLRHQYKLYEGHFVAGAFAEDAQLTVDANPELN